MKLIKNKRGFSLVELIVVIAIMAVLVGLISPVFIGSLEKSRRAVDDANVSMLNRVTQVYSVNEEKKLPDVFEGISTDDDRMDELVDKNYITKVVEPMMADTEFIWSVPFQEWYSNEYLVNENNNNILSYIFGGTSADDYVTTDNWSINDNGAESKDGRMFIGNPNDEYTITVNATLDSDKSATNGGYGIFFDTKFQEDNSHDTGYILQFDRGINCLKIDKRSSLSGSQGGVKQATFDNGDSIYLPDGKRDSWWTEPHEITMDVKVIDAESNTKTVTVKIDGDEVITNYEFESEVTAAENQTGFRSWYEETLYEDITITGKE